MGARRSALGWVNCFCLTWFSLYKKMINQNKITWSFLLFVLLMYLPKFLFYLIVLQCVLLIEIFVLEIYHSKQSLKNKNNLKTISCNKIKKKKQKKGVLAEAITSFFFFIFLIFNFGQKCRKNDHLFSKISIVFEVKFHQNGTFWFSFCWICSISQKENLCASFFYKLKIAVKNDDCNFHFC